MSKVILLAEDSTDDAAYLKRSLNVAGVSSVVHVVNDGEQVLAYLNGDGIYADRNMFPWPRVLFLDLTMPRMDGWKVLEWLRTKPAMLARMLVIVLSGTLQRDRLQEVYSLGAQTFLLKPFHAEDMKHLVQFWPDAWDFAGGNSPSQPPPQPPSQPNA